ncbi:hypothetical protein HNO52_01925 [Billgrantia diversa]|uniref:hypothetical protein n=1 Tax=Halomonas sp. MCCC 1A13316 TaxID=2733487 RepID=UPI0018A4DE31|nr:hypothetical protein [Halomonas sp. MCCC 1A13316]QOR37405.1 hypothetical protein HNO52_01925 [Halomonas sp. MCCC 1A13316]
MGDWIIPENYPELRLICWSIRTDQPIKEREAWEIYERNWRYVYQNWLTEEEKALIERLRKKYGVSDGSGNC